MTTILYVIIGLLIGCTIAFLIYFFLNKNIKNLVSENSVLKNDLNEKNSQINEFIREKAILESSVKNAEEKLNTQKEEIVQLREELNKEFKLLANQIFEEKTQKFSQVNEEKLSNILNPLKEKLQNFEKKVEDTYSNETREKASLSQQIKNLVELNSKMQTEAANLTKALKGDKKMQGNWGEIQLEQLLEKSGLQRGIHYSKQENFITEDGEKFIPDYVVNLPDNKHYIINSKISLVNYEQFFNSENDDEKKYFLAEHIKNINKHIDELNRKNYQNLINSPDFVFMYFAVEPALFIALQNDMTLFDRALQKNIILLSNTTLLASLRTVSFIWKQENQKNNVLEIAKIGGQLYDKFVSFSENLMKIGKSIEIAQNTYLDAKNQLIKQNTDGTYNAGTIVGMTEKIKQLGANATKNISKGILNKVEEISEPVDNN